MRNHTTSMPFKCPQCDFATKTNEQLTNHIKRKHSENKIKDFPCLECDKAFHIKDDLTKHLKLGHKQKKQKKSLDDLPCEVCGNVFNSQQGLKMHQRWVHRNETMTCHICETCGQSFEWERTLCLHVRLEHPSDDAIHRIECKCEKCNVTFSSAQILNDHLVECLTINRPRFTCGICEQTNKCPSTFHTVNDRRQEDTCEDCHLGSWHSAIALKKHVGEKHRLIRFVCDECGKTLTKAANLKSHITNTHQGLKEWNCDQCDKRYGKKSHLRAHKEHTHSTETFKCDQCVTVLKSRLSLKIHTKIVHERTIQFECDHCDFTSFHKSSLNQHFRRVHQHLKPHLCSYCGKEFFEKSICVRHMVKSHGHKTQ